MDRFVLFFYFITAGEAFQSLPVLIRLGSRLSLLIRILFAKKEPEQQPEAFGLIRFLFSCHILAEDILPFRKVPYQTQNINANTPPVITIHMTKFSATSLPAGFCSTSSSSSPRGAPCALQIN